MIREFYKMTWLDIKNIDKDKACILLPIGSLEQHGPHLPLGTDDLILTNVMRGILKAESSREKTDSRLHIGSGNEVLCLPPLLFGNSHEHYSFPGTVSLTCNTLVKIVEDILASISEHGFKRLIVFNSHGGITDLIKAYAQEWEQHFSVKVYLISLWSGLYDDKNEDSIFVSDANVDIHAGERETALLMHYDANLVKEDMISADTTRDVKFKAYYTGWQTDEISTGNGTLGYPLYATAEKGEKYARFLVERTRELIYEILKE